MIDDDDDDQIHRPFSQQMCLSYKYCNAMPQISAVIGHTGAGQVKMAAMKKVYSLHISHYGLPAMALPPFCLGTV